MTPIERVYLAGPMSGRPERNRELFHGVATRLRCAGLDVANPAEINYDWETTEPCERLRRDFEAMLHCDAVFVLPEWEQSPGATREVAIASWCGIPVYKSDEPYSAVSVSLACVEDTGPLS